MARGDRGDGDEGGGHLARGSRGPVPAENDPPPPEGEAPGVPGAAQGPDVGGSRRLGGVNSRSRVRRRARSQIERTTTAATMAMATPATMTGNPAGGSPARYRNETSSVLDTSDPVELNVCVRALFPAAGA